MKANPRIAWVDIDPYLPSGLKTTFASKISLLDADIAIVDPQPFITNFLTPKTNSTSGKIRLNEDEWREVSGWLTFRSEQFKDMQKYGRHIVMLVAKPPPVFVDRSRSPADTPTLDNFFPWGRDILKEERGSRMEPGSSDSFLRLWSSIGAFTYYRAVFTDVIGQPVLKVADTDVVVGSLLGSGPGCVLLLPALKNGLHHSDFEKIEPALIQFLAEVSTPISKSFSMPDWHQKYLVPGESESLQKLRDLEARQARLEEEQSRTQLEISRLQSMKLLFTGTGGNLVDQVAGMLGEIGLEAIVDPQHRDDIIASFGDSEFVFEIKGKSKSAAEKDAAQLEKWVSSYFEANEREAKGVLIVNAFREEELNVRETEAFPEQMIGYAKRKELCLMSGLQFLGFYLACKSDPHSVQQHIDSIRKTTGRYQGFTDWHAFLDVVGK